MTSLNIGCGRNPVREPGWVNLDVSGDPDILCDLEDAKLPFPDNTFAVVQADHVIEHIRNLLPLVQEIWRVTKPEGLFVANVPYVGCDQAFEDPTHVRFFAPFSFGFFSQPVYWRSDYGYRGDFKVETMLICCHQYVFDKFGAQYILERFPFERNLITELRVTMRCIKPARPLGVGPQDEVPLTLQPVSYYVGGQSVS